MSDRRSSRAAARRRASLLRSESGVSLIEALVAAIVLAIGVLGSAAAFTGSDKATLDSEYQQVATDQALLALERVRALDYAEVGHSGSGTPSVPSGETAPTATTYTAPDAPGSEQLVTGATAESGESTANFRISPAAQSRAFSVPAASGGPAITGHVYTVVTWRDEECELVQIGAVKAAISALNTQLAARQAQLNSLNSGLLDILNPLLPAPARNLKDSNHKVAGIPANVPALLGLIAALQDKITTLQATLDGLSTADLCDLKLSQLTNLFKVLETNDSGALQVKASITAPIEADAALETQTAAVQSVLAPLASVSCLLPLAKPLCDASNSLIGTIGGSTGAYVSLSDLNSNLAALNTSMAGTQNTTHNTKRVTVIVTVDRARSDQTPANPVYLSTIVIDPEDGLVLAS